MGAISFQGSLFGHGAAQPAKGVTAADPMERAILACEKKDAGILRQALHNLTNFFSAREGNASDPMENAILASRRRDAAIVRNLLAGH